MLLHPVTLLICLVFVVVVFAAKFVLFVRAIWRRHKGIPPVTIPPEKVCLDRVFVGSLGGVLILLVLRLGLREYVQLMRAQGYDNDYIHRMTIVSMTVFGNVIVLGAIALWIMGIVGVGQVLSRFRALRRHPKMIASYIFLSVPLILFMTIVRGCTADWMQRTHLLERVKGWLLELLTS
jgi:hypothetical protein